MNTKNSVFKEPEKLCFYGAEHKAMDHLETDTVAENDTAPQDIDIVTFGCRLNIHESEVMRDHAKNAG
ncbi:MAG: hypothetical protein EP349_08960, partial [Alphaproteobacteria bacterium]